MVLDEVDSPKNVHIFLRLMVGGGDILKIALICFLIGWNPPCPWLKPKNSTDFEHSTFLYGHLHSSF